MDDLVRNATALYPADRTESVRDFLADLDKVEEELTAPDREPAVDPLTAGKGDEIEGWTVERVLGKGSTSRALLVKRGEQLPRLQGGAQRFRGGSADPRGGAARRSSPIPMSPG